LALSILRLGIAISACTASAQQSNFVINPGFETGDLTGWTLASGPGSVVVNNTNPHSGTSAAYFASTNTFAVITQTVPTSPIGFYAVQFWLANPSMSPASSHFQALWNGNVIFDSTNSSFPYREEARGGNLGSPGSSSILTFQGYGLNGSYYLDDIRVIMEGTVSDIVRHAFFLYLASPARSFASYAIRLGLSQNQIAVGYALDQTAGHPRTVSEQMALYGGNPLLRFLYNNELEGNLAEDFNRIAPTDLASIFPVGFSLAAVQSANLQRRMEDLRRERNDARTVSSPMTGSGPAFTVGFSAPIESDRERITLSGENRWGSFLMGSGEFTRIGNTSNANGYDLTTGGLTVGVDYRLTPNFVVGMMSGYANTGVDLANRGHLDVDGGKLGLYATYFKGGFFVDGAVIGGYNDYHTRRSALQGDAYGRTSGGELDLMIGTGYEFKKGGLTLGPTLGFEYSKLALDGFTENGSLAPLTLGYQQAESIRSLIGAKASYDWHAHGVTVRPGVRAAWQHEYADREYSVVSRFASGGVGNFTVKGPAIGRDSLRLGAGFDIHWNGRVSTSVYYDAELGRTNYSSHNISAGMRIAF
jgi:outer membrane autotransporter protein